MIVAIYARVSTADQEADNQICRLSELAYARGYTRMNCSDCRHYLDDEDDVPGSFYCTWHNDWIPKKWINGNEGCPGHFTKVEE